MKTLLMILDGVGINNKNNGNAVSLAKTPNLDYLFKRYPHSTLEASGTLVGLPEGQMGNSEVGHLNIGAGRVIYQPLQKINNEIKSGKFYKNENILNLIKYSKDSGRAFHIVALVSDGGVHSSMLHIISMIKILREKNINFYVHVITDGRDTSPSSALKYINELKENLDDESTIATISGRYYAMDRDNRYDRVKKAYDVMAGISDVFYDNVNDAIKTNYDKGITDEFIVPGIINKKGVIKNKDAVFFVNFRPDRLRELGSALTNPSFSGFEIKNKLFVNLLTMMPVSDEVICSNAYQLNEVSNTLGVVVADNNLKQLRIAETEKYAHVTYFFDGGKELNLKNCKRILVPSPKVSTYDLKPEMSVFEITDTLIKNLPNFDFVVLNFANGDMVGHTGNLKASIIAMEALDICIGKIYKELIKLGWTLVLTADHGNCEQMADDSGNVLTSHTTNKVPFLITKDLVLRDGKLEDIAPTILNLLDIMVPEEMTGDNLISGFGDV